MGMTRRGKQHASDRPSWPEEGGTDTNTLPSYWPEAKTEAVVAGWPAVVGRRPGRQRSEPLWDLWYARAMEEGVEEELAALGRSVIGAAREQLWDEDVRAECGWMDEGDAMLDLATYAPDRAETHWRALLDRD